jgi:type IV pilus assembly protein PilQ
MSEMEYLSTVWQSLRWLRSVGAVLLFGVCFNLAGCSAVGHRPEPAKPRLAATPPLAAPSPARIQETTLQAHALQLQDLSVHEEQGQSTLSIKFSRPVNEFRHFSLSQPARIVVDVFGTAKQPAHPEVFRLDTHWLSTLRVGSITGGLRITFDVAAATVPNYAVTTEDGGIRVVVGPVAPDLTAKKASMLVQGGKRTGVTGPDRASAATGQTNPNRLLAEEALAQEKRYTGQKISLDFKDADIRNVFRLLAEVSGLNIVVTSDVAQKVTVRLTEVPWDQALDLLIETHGLAKEQIGNIVRISTAAALKAERDALAAAQKARTQRQPLQTTYLPFNYPKVRELEPKVKVLLSKRPEDALVVD